MKQSAQYLLVIASAPASLFATVNELRQRPAYANLELLILTPHPKKYAKADEQTPRRVIACDYRSDEVIGAALRPFHSQIVGVVCRGDKYVQYLRRVIPFLPPEVLVATPGALAAATNKRQMRADFMQHFPEITPRFLEVHDSTPETITRIEEAVQYPVIVKPANLASSLLIQSCHTHTELAAALTKTFAEIERIYEIENRTDPPQVIVEEYMEGDFYSIDAYVREPGDVQCLPPVAYVPAKQLGIDDFFLYKRYIPTNLAAEDMQAANRAVEKSISAVGLSHSTAHVELVLTRHGWKIIELGPRIGRFRHSMYSLAYGINHTLNDVLLHLGERPHVPTTFHQYCAAYSIYPEQEGILREITNLNYLLRNPVVSYLKVIAQPGDYCRHAKNGGHALAEFIISSSDKHEYDKVAAYVEANIKVSIEIQ